jgi:uncharacterized protein YutE (UPF0331/DUF86 family)
MVNRNKVNQILKILERYMEELNGMKPLNLNELKKVEKRYATAFLIEQIVNECINLGNHLISTLDLETPSSFKEVFDNLVKGKIITTKTAEKMKFLVEIRNVIAHRYRSFSNQDLLNAVKKIGAVKEYVNEILKSIR